MLPLDQFSSVDDRSSIKASQNRVGSGKVLLTITTELTVVPCTDLVYKNEKVSGLTPDISFKTQNLKKNHHFSSNYVQKLVSGQSEEDFGLQSVLKTRSSDKEPEGSGLEWFPVLVPGEHCPAGFNAEGHRHQQKSEGSLQFCDDKILNI